MESRTPTHNRTAPRMKRKKMSLLTCVSLWSLSGSVVPTEDMARKEKAPSLFSGVKGKYVSFSPAVLGSVNNKKCKITADTGIYCEE